MTRDQTKYAQIRYDLLKTKPSPTITLDIYLILIFLFFTDLIGSVHESDYLLKLSTRYAKMTRKYEKYV